MALFTAIATAVGSLFTSGFAASAFGKFLIKTLARVATSLLVKAISGGNTSGYSGLQGTLQSGEEVPRGAPFGKCASEGSLVYANTWGKAGKTPNAYFTQVIALSDLPIKGVLRVMVNGSFVTLLSPADANMGSPVSEFRVDGTDHLWVKVYDGTQTVADPFLVSSVSSTERPYEATRVGTGVAYAICTSRIDQTLFTTFPKFRFELDSVRLYDPSKDTTAGGSGSQRWADRSTWGGDGDYLPAVQAYNIMRGITYAGTWLFGFNGMSAGRIPLDDLIASINACRATVSVGASASEPRYRSGGYLQFSSECGSVLEAIMMAAAGRIVDIGGVYNIQVGNGSTAVDASITDADLRSEHDAPFYPVKGLADLINGVTAQYPNPADGYNPRDAKAIYRTDLEALDQNRRLPVQLSFTNVPYPHQVRRLMRIAIGEARRFRRHTLPLPSDFWALEPGDVIAWTSDRHGYDAKKFRVTAVMEEPTSEITADVVEIDPSDYDPPDYSDYPAVPTWQSVIKLPAPETLRGWGVSAGTAKDGAGSDRRPTVVCVWDTDDLDGCEGVSIEIALNGGAVVVRKFIRNFKAGKYVWDSPLPDTAYMARGVLVADRPTEWTGWVTASTDNLKFSFVDMAAPFIDAFDDAVATANAALSGHNALVAGFNGTLVEALDDANALANAGLEGWLMDPTFRDWSGTPLNLTAANWAGRGGTSAYASPGGGDFGGGLNISAPATSAEVYVVASSDAGLVNANASADYVVVTMHLTYGAGDPTGGRLRVEWSPDGVTWTQGDCIGQVQSPGQFLSLGIGVNPSARQAFQFLWKRPTGISGKIRLFACFKTPSPMVATEAVVHLLNLGPATKAQIDAGQTYVMASATPGSTVTTAGIGAALVQLNSAMTARVGGNEASITSLEAVTADTDSAVAVVKQTLSATASAGTAYFRDTFDGDLSNWQVIGGAGEIVAVASLAGVGAKILRLGNNAGNDQVTIAHKHLIPFDPNKFYKTTIRVRKTAGAGTFYAGFLGVAADGVTLVDTSGANTTGAHWHVTNGVAVGASFEDKVGYTQGRTAPGLGSPGTAANPSEMHSSVAYLRPILLANYSGAAGTFEIAHVTVDDGTIADAPATVEILSGVIADLTDTAMYSIRLNTSGGESKMELVSSSDPAGPATAINLVSDNILMRASNVLVGQGNLFPDFDMADDRFYFNTSGGVFSFIPTATAPLGARYLALNADTVIQTVYSRWFRVDPSTEYRITGAAWTQTATAGTGTATLYAQTASVDAGGVASVLTTNAVKATTDATYSSATSWGTIALTTGSTARLMRFAMARAAGGTGGALFGGFMVDRKVGSDLIVTGAVTAAALNADDLNIAGVGIFGGTLKSTSYTAGSTGWAIKSDGSAEFNDAVFRGKLGTTLINSDGSLRLDTGGGRSAPLGFSLNQAGVVSATSTNKLTVSLPLIRSPDSGSGFGATRITADLLILILTGSIYCQQDIAFGTILADVQYSKNGGAWTNDQTITSSGGRATPFVAALSPGAPFSGTYQIRVVSRSGAWVNSMMLSCNVNNQ